MLRLALVLFTVTPLAAQTPQATGAIEGVVTDGAGETLPLANIWIEETSLGTAADSAGEFRRIEIPVGTYSVTASFAGLQPSTVYDVEVRAGETARLIFDLGVFVSDCNLSPVFYRPMVSSDPFASRVIVAEELARLPVR